MAAMCSQYLQPSQQKCSCKEIPAPEYLVLPSNGLHLSTKKGNKALCKALENEPYRSGLGGDKGCNIFVL